MQVYRPCRGERGILMKDILVYVVLLEDIVTEKAAGLTLSGNVPDPVKIAVLPFRIVLPVVLEPAPIGIYHQQTIVTDPLGILYLVIVHACFPFPFSHCHLLAVAVVEFHSVGEFRERGSVSGIF